MKKLVFATNNKHKLEEVKAVLGDRIEIISLSELNCYDDIPETADTLEGNALLKAQYVYKKFGLNCFADDTGLEVDALNGEPGIHSARYAGSDNDAQNNMNKLLEKLSNNPNRNACFRTVIALIEHGETHYFEGKIEGDILFEAEGKAGFGYDPIFQPKGYKQSFAMIGMDIKNNISHRALAVGRLAEHLNKEWPLFVSK